MNNKMLVLLTLVLALTTLKVVGGSNTCNNLRKTFIVATASADDTYEMGVCEGIADNPDKAFAYLSMAVNKGFNDADWMMADPDLEQLSQDPRWLPLVQRTEKIQQDLLVSTLQENKL